MNEGLGAAKAGKKDEFYTQYIDIQKEVEAYLEYDPNTFRGKVVYCNCDDPFESNFFKFFAANFNRLGLKKLISTSYDGSPIAGEQLSFDDAEKTPHKAEAIAIEIEEVTDLNNDGATDIEDIRLFLEANRHKRIRLKGSGDFRSPECVELLRQADIVVTNPPFSLFREYVAQLIDYNKKFLIIGNQNAITYNDIFPLIRGNKLWLGVTIRSGDREFRVPDHYPLDAAGSRIDENGVKYIRVKGVRWYTNLDHGRRHEKLPLMTLADNVKFSKHKEVRGIGYETYCNFDALEVPFTDAIPSDFDGIMGVPITFLDKYDPDQFEIVANGDDRDEMQALGVPPLGPEYVGNAGRRKVGVPSTKKAAYKRIFIRHRRPITESK
ncbi:MAG: adenine-specific methyltransferase EcoRI family protein [Erythrobacter sp.]